MAKQLHRQNCNVKIVRKPRHVTELSNWGLLIYHTITSQTTLLLLYPGSQCCFLCLPFYIFDVHSINICKLPYKDKNRIYSKMGNLEATDSWLHSGFNIPCCGWITPQSASPSEHSPYVSPLQMKPIPDIPGICRRIVQIWMLNLQLLTSRGPASGFVNLIHYS